MCAWVASEYSLHTVAQSAQLFFIVEVQTVLSDYLTAGARRLPCARGLFAGLLRASGTAKMGGCSPLRRRAARSLSRERYSARSGRVSSDGKAAIDGPAVCAL